jgi:hypothetical protein
VLSFRGKTAGSGDRRAAGVEQAVELERALERGLGEEGSECVRVKRYTTCTQPGRLYEAVPDAQRGGGVREVRRQRADAVRQSGSGDPRAQRRHVRGLRPRIYCPPRHSHADLALVA